MADNYDLSKWKASALLKAAAEHLRDQPDYVPLEPLARAELFSFAHTVRRQLREAKDKADAGDQGAFQTFSNKYGLSISTHDHCRFIVDVHGYRLILFPELNLTSDVPWTEQTRFEPEEKS